MLLWGALLSSAAGAELRLLSWSENVCRAARFEANSSGRMRITDDPAEKAVRIEVEFPPAPTDGSTLICGCGPPNLSPASNGSALNSGRRRR